MSLIKNLNSFKIFFQSFLNFYFQHKNILHNSLSHFNLSSGLIFLPGSDRYVQSCFKCLYIFFSLPPFYILSMNSTSLTKRVHLMSKASRIEYFFLKSSTAEQHVNFSLKLLALRFGRTNTASRVVFSVWKLNNNK